MFDINWDDPSGTADFEHLSLQQLVTRLENYEKKLDGVKHENICLKEEVNQVRRQKLQVNSIFDRLRANIKQRTDQLLDFVEETGASKVVNGEAKYRISVLRKQQESGRLKFKNEVMKIRKEMFNYEIEKREVEVQLRKEGSVVQKKKELITPPEELSWSESSMMRRIIKTAFLNCIQRRHIKQHQKSIEVFDQAFSTIKHSTGIANIEEIVKIFMAHESRNYSLLTYVNQMNREIETLEGLQRSRQMAGVRWIQKQEQQNKAREEALGDLQKHLQATQQEVEAHKEACARQRELLKLIFPVVKQVAKILEDEGKRLRASSTTPPTKADEYPRKPIDELREDTLLTWLQWVEQTLGRFRDLLPAQSFENQFFPVTAYALVKQLQPKKFNQQQPAPLVKPQELPSCSLMVDDLTAVQKRQAAPMSAAAKAELLDDESDEEDLGDRPLAPKDIRARAEQAALKKKRRERSRASVVAEAVSSREGVARLSTEHARTATPESTHAEVEKFQWGTSGAP